MIVPPVVPSHLLARVSARNARTRTTGRTNETSAERAGRHASRGPRAKGGEATTTKREKKAKTGEKVIVPTPEEWAEEQLKNAPPRSEEWARKVARIYCLDIGDDTRRENGIRQKRDPGENSRPGSRFIRVGYSVVSLRNTGTI